jgi:hypothetical protein
MQHRAYLKHGLPSAAGVPLLLYWSKRRADAMTTERVRYSFTINFVEPEMEEYEVSAMAAEANISRDTVISSILGQKAEQIIYVAERIEALIMSDQAIMDMLAQNGIQLQMGLSH